jgi:hypothetical protein
MSLHVEWSVRAGEQLQEHMENLEVRASTEVANHVFVRILQRLDAVAGHRFRARSATHGALARGRGAKPVLPKTTPGVRSRVLGPQDGRIALAPSAFPSDATVGRAFDVRPFDTVGVALKYKNQRPRAPAQLWVVAKESPRESPTAPHGEAAGSRPPGTRTRWSSRTRSW